jgi:hypothetical protein
LLKHISVFTLGEYGGTVVNSDQETIGYWYLNDTSDGGEWTNSDSTDQGYWRFDDGSSDTGTWWHQNGITSGTWTTDSSDSSIKHILYSPEGYDGIYNNEDGELEAYWFFNDE